MTTKTKIHFAPTYFQNPSHNLSVTLIGCGGTGSQVLTSLARMNATLVALGHPGLHVYVYDGDVVTESNIGRQLFSPSDINRFKSDVLVERINRYFNLNWQSCPHNIDKTYDIQSNIIISCVDNIKTRKLIDLSFKDVIQRDHTDYKKAYYWLDFGNTNDAGQVILASRKIVLKSKFEKYQHVSQLPTIFKLFPEFEKIKEKNTGPSCSVAEAIKKQDLFVNSILAQLGCNLLWKLIKEGSLEYQGLFMNLKTMNVKPIKIK